MMNYLFEFSVINTVLVTAYWALLRKDRNYHTRRFYLVGTAILSIVIPLVKLPKLFYVNNPYVSHFPAQFSKFDVDGFPAMISTTPETAAIAESDFILLFFLAISAVFLLNFSRKIFRILQIRSNSNCQKVNEIKIFKASGIGGSFAFFNSIFIDCSVDEKQKHFEIILAHEKAHVSLKHSYDLIFLELFKICFWWLPASWYLLYEIKKIHEFEADAFVLKSVDLRQYASTLIHSTLKINGLHIVSSFNDNFILKRISAMKGQTRKTKAWKLGILISLVATLFFAFACSEESSEITKILKEPQGMKNSDPAKSIPLIVEKLPEFDGGLKAFDTYVERNINYPSKALDAGIEGHVFIQFTVEKDGTVSSVQSVKGFHRECDHEAVRVIRDTPKFTPAIYQGKPIKVDMILPVTFKINEEKSIETGGPIGIIISEGAKIIS